MGDAHVRGNLEAGMGPRDVIDQLRRRRHRRRMRHLAEGATINTTGAFDDDSAGAVFDLEHDSDSLLIAFGGIAGHLGVPVFEFFKVTGSVDAKRAFIRDHRRAWYHRGVAGATSSIEETAQYLRAAIRNSGVRRTVMVGNSAGGYAALLFGVLAGADSVIAFAPQTFISAELRARHGDDRWAKEIAALRASGCEDPRYLDLVDVLRPGQRRDIYYSSADRLDTLHAERMDGVATLHRHEVGAHDLVRELRNSGELRTILEATLG
jgi:hypothetical protein